MSTQQVVIHGRIRPDGTLQVDERVNLPPGPVSVTVQSMHAPPGKPTLQVLEDIWAERAARGIVGRSKEEIDTEIAAMREEDERRIREIEAIGAQPSDKPE
jgi:hypothetical protein